MKAKYLFIVVLFLFSSVYSMGQESEEDNSAHNTFLQSQQSFYNHNSPQAVSLCKSAAERGCIHAMARYGEYNEWGVGGLQKNADSAASWYRKSAEKGCAWGEYRLGTCYYNGKGVPKNYINAVKWFRLSSKQNGMESTWALEKLSKCYFNGQGVDKDYKTALNLAKEAVSKASHQTVPEAHLVIAECYYNGYCSDKDYNLAFENVKEAVDDGGMNPSKEAMLLLSKCYRFGRGTNVDIEKADFWFQKAAKK